MSTIFGVKLKNGEITEIAHRSDKMTWLNDLGPLLPFHTDVIPMDNTAQGIYTIGDIKDEITGQQEKCPLCKEKEKTWGKDNSPIKCCFPDGGHFDQEGWNCGTLDVLRDKVYNCYLSIKDDKYGLVPYQIQTEDGMIASEGVIYMSWYKDRGETDIIKIIDTEGNVNNNPTLQDIEDTGILNKN